MNIQYTLAAMFLLSATHLSVGAAFIVPQSWDRGLGGATYQHWDFFESYPTDNSPDVGSINPNGTASLSETTGTGVALGSGNIYNPAGPAQFTVTVPELDVPGPPHNVSAIVQFRTLGTELDYSSVRVNGLPPIATTELLRIVLGGFGGSSVDTWMFFNIPYANFGDGVPGVENLSLTFQASGPHMSLDQLSIDTAIIPFGFYSEPTPIPEPNTGMLMIAFCGVAGCLWLAKQQRSGPDLMDI